jgi:transposase
LAGRAQRRQNFRPLTTKIHALVDALGNPHRLMLSPGQAHDLAGAQPLLETVEMGACIAEKAYDADTFVERLTTRKIAVVIPSKANRKTPRPCDFALYRERNLVERFFNKLKHFRAIATRYAKLARNFPRRNPTRRCDKAAQLKVRPRCRPKLGPIR